MNTAPDRDDADVERLIDGHLDGTLADDDQRRLSRLVAGSDAVARRLAEAMLVHDRLIDLLRRQDAGRAAIAPAARRPPGGRSLRLALPVGLVALVGLGCLLLLRPAPANASAALERIVRATALSADREYAIRVVDSGSEGMFEPVPADVGGRKPGLDGARLYLRGADRFVFVRTYADGTTFVNGCDGSIGWSVPPTGHVHCSRDPRRFRRGMPGERDDLPFLSLGEGLSGLRRGYALSLAEVPGQAGRLRLEAVRTDPRHRGPARATIDFAVGDGGAERIELAGLSPDGAGPDRVVLELVDRAPLPSDFFDHAHHHDASRPVDWE